MTMRVAARPQESSAVMSLQPRTGRQPRKAARMLAFCRLVTVISAVVLLLGSPMRILCFEAAGRVAIESAWATCCATGQPDALSAPVSSAHLPGARDARDGDHCFDVLMDCPADHTSRVEAHRQAWPNTTDADRASHDADSGQTLAGELARLLPTVGHSGSVLVALRTVQLLI